MTRRAAAALAALAMLFAPIGPVAADGAAPLDRAAACPISQVDACFSQVAERAPAELVAYLAGGHPDYPGSGPDSPLDFSPSDILETMDTVVLDRVARSRGPDALGRLYETIARAALATLRELYPDELILLALDAGHGGARWDPGAAGTEAEHNRAVADLIAQLAASGEYGRIVVRPIYNDAIVEELGLPPELDKPIVDSVLIRQSRASMLARELAAWKRGHPGPEGWIAMHELSVHFNAGAGGAMVLHQGETAEPEFVSLSRAYGERYLQRVIAELNATGLLPSRLRRWGGDGLHDDVMMYRPAYFRDDEIRGITLRYGALQGRGFLPRYVATVLARSSYIGR